MINITIDNRKIQCPEGTTILSAAREAGIFIPSLCHDDRFPAHGSCSLCMVEIAGNNRLARACATPVIEGMDISTHSRRVVAARKRLLELLLSAHTGDCKAPCQLACPAQTDCQGYIALISEGRLQEAAQRMMEAHPFPGSIARVCPQPCEEKCRRGLHDEPVNIAGLKRFAADTVAKAYFFNEAGATADKAEITSNGSNPGQTATDVGEKPSLCHAVAIANVKPPTGNTVAIVGGGPAGLTAAYFLRRAGHRVDVYECMPKMGGLLRYGIPEYRLPKAVLDRELDVLTQMGIGFRNNVRLVEKMPSDDSDLRCQSTDANRVPGLSSCNNPGSNRAADSSPHCRQVSLSYLQERYDAVIIATGAGISRPMGIPGEDLPGVVGGIDFLKMAACKVADNKSVTIGKTITESSDSHCQEFCDKKAARLDSAAACDGKRVVVIGGSNTAIDAARTALRLGAESVTVAYRRTRDEMPAEFAEISEAEVEGVGFKFLVAPIEVTGEKRQGDGSFVTGIRLQQMELGESEPDGRRSPRPLQGQEEWFPADMIITAVGQAVAHDGLESLEKARSAIKADPVTLQTSRPGVFAIGDAIGQSAYAIEAIGHGRNVAAAVHEFLCIAQPQQVVSHEICCSQCTELSTGQFSKQRKSHIIQNSANNSSVAQELYSTPPQLAQNRRAMPPLPKLNTASQSLPWETLPGILVRDDKNLSDFAHISKSPRENGAKLKWQLQPHHQTESMSSSGATPIPKNEAPKGFEEVHQNLTATQAAKEAGRCLSCGCGDYDECKLISFANEYRADPTKYSSTKKPKHPIDTGNPRFTSDPNKCVLCGLCIQACSQDRAILTMAHRGFETMVASHPKSNCAQCGNCAAVCPVGARIWTQNVCI